MTQHAQDVFKWIMQELHPAESTSAEMLYDHMTSQSDESLPIIYQPFDASNLHHWRDRGSAFDYLLATKAVGKRVLDFGPGDGWPSLIIAPYVHEVVGVDGSRKRVEVCTENAARLGLDNARFVHVEPGSRLPFEDESFDAVVAASSVEQSPDPKATLRELYRVLKPGGQLRIDYEALNRYRGAAESEAWLWAVDPNRCRLMLYQRHIDQERAEHYRLTFDMPEAALAGALNATEDEVTIENVTVEALEKLRSRLINAEMFTTIHPSGKTLTRWLREVGFGEVRPTHSGARFSGRLYTELGARNRPMDQKEIDAIVRPAVGAAVQLAAPIEDDPMITAIKSPGEQTLDLHLGVIIDANESHYQAQLLEKDDQIEAVRSEAMIEYGVKVAAGQAVVVDLGRTQARLVWTWYDLEAKHTESGWTLGQDGQTVDLETLKKEQFPRIQAMYAPRPHPIENPKELVRDGYDQISQADLASLDSLEHAAVRKRYLAMLLDRLSQGARVLELGCGAGQTAHDLSKQFLVTGVDISSEQIARARKNAPKAVLLRADMTKLEFAPETFDGVMAFYSLFHVPRQEQPDLLQNIASWLRPGGLLVAVLGIHASETDIEDFFGVPMFWSGWGREGNLDMIEAAGLQVIQAEEVDVIEAGEPVSFLWVAAIKTDD